MLIVLTKYLLLAALWMQSAKNHARADGAEWVTTNRYESISHDLAEVTLEDGEPPLFPEPHARAKTAVLLLALSFWESGLRADVDTGKLLGDNGLATSILQIHADEQGGITLDGLRFKYANARSATWLSMHPFDVHHGRDLARDRKLAIRCGLHLARVSLYNWSTARNALATAAAFMRAHPFKAE